MNQNARSTKLLLSCPFCGSKAQIVASRGGRGIYYSVGCTECKARKGDYSSEEIAIRAWNRRANFMATVIHAPEKYVDDKFTIFLGGVIDMGTAVDWQQKVIDALADCDVQILNPRRKDWDSSWTQEKTNPQFSEQVTWELNGQESADLNIYVFAPDSESAKTSKAPITFLELGLFGSASKNKKNHIMVCCPEGFYRKGNVDIVCEKYGIPVYNNLDTLISNIKLHFKRQYGTKLN